MSFYSSFTLSKLVLCGTSKGVWLDMFDPSPLYVLVLFVHSCEGNSQDAVQKTVQSCLFSTGGLPSAVSCGGRRG